MTKEFTAEQTRAWRASQPQKMIVAKVVIKSDQGNVLLAKPDFKKTWQLPGGAVESGESPEDAAVRETQEEIHLDISIEDLVIKGTIYKKDLEILFVVYESTHVVSEDIELQTQEGEITDFQFVSVSDAPALMSDYYAGFWRKNYSS